MRESTVLAARPGYTVSAVTCADDHRGWSAPEAATGHRVVLVRRGRFRRRVAGRVADVDPTLAYVAVPGDEEYFAHPAGGDVCTCLDLDPGLLGPPPSTVYVDGALDLAHRRVLAAARDPDYALAEQLLDLVGRATGRAARDPGGDTALVARAREAIAADDPAAATLFGLAGRLGVSPYRLSRAFTRELGVSLTRYRNRVRVGRALDRWEAGDTDLAALAADLGFADQAHLTRTVREHTGATPAVLRKEVRKSGAEHAVLGAWPPPVTT